MWTSILPVAALFAIVAGACYKQERMYYSELGCKPGPLGDDGCPTSYTCSERAPDKCQYQGVQYITGHRLDLSAHCLANCYCTRSPLNNKTAFSCVNIECSELFTDPPPHNCHRIYEHGKCCKVDEVCVDPADQTNRPVCQYNGSVFEIGQRFYVNEECKQCICQPGFNGSFVEPFCRSTICTLELLFGFYVADGCAPVFRRDSDCCPLTWRCPDPVDSVLSMNEDKKHNAEEGLTCQFGGLKMQVGDVLSPNAHWPNTLCKCRVPPHPVCVHTTSAT